MVQGSGFRVYGLVVGVKGLGFSIQCSGLRVQGSGVTIQGLGFMV